MPADEPAQSANNSYRAPSGARKQLPEWVATTALLLPTYAWLTLAVFLPLCAMFAFSFLSKTPMGKAPVEFTLKNYRAFIDQPFLIGVAWDSFLMGFWTTFFCAVLGFVAALALVRSCAGRTREVLLVLILLPFWTNGLVRIFSWTMVLREGGFLDTIVHFVLPDVGSVGFLYTRPAVIVGLVQGYLPYMILTCYIALSNIDDALIEAATSLGARWWTILRTILLPLAMPGLLAGSILIFVPVIGSFMEPRILGGRVGVTMGTVIEDQFTQAFNWPLGSALSFMLLAVVLGIFATFSGVLRQQSNL